MPPAELKNWRGETKLLADKRQVFMHVRGSENKLKWQKKLFTLFWITYSPLTKTQKPIQMFQLGVGHSQMHPPLFYIPASEIGFQCV